MTRAVPLRVVRQRLMRSFRLQDANYLCRSGFSRSEHHYNFSFHPMKTSWLTIILLSSTIVETPGQIANTTTQGSVNQPALPSATPYQVVGRDANSAIWERTVYELGPAGQIIPRPHRYTELATGLNHLVSGQWVASREEIDISPDGNSAAATNGQHQAYFPGDIAQGVIELDTPDGLKLQSRPIALSYDDGSNTVLFAVLTNATGAILPSTNQVIYQGAFTGVAADLLYTYTKAGFEQNIILRAQPPTPDSFGLNPQTARLQVLTEFFNPPQPAVATMALPEQAGISLTDENLNFGVMNMVQGRAFLLGSDTQDGGVLVSKSWVQLGGRQFLVEEVPVAALADELAQLSASPTISIKPNPPLNVVSRKRLLPIRRPLSVPGKHAMQVAQNIPMSRGLVLDYVTLNSNQTNYTFQGDTTYYISGPFYSYGTNTFEDGVVLKYATNGSVQIQSVGGYSPAIKWRGGPYRPVVFTAKDDNTVGESFGSGTPSGYYGNPMLSLSSISPAPTLTGMRVSYAQTGIKTVAVSANIYDAQFMNCQSGLLITGGSVLLGNALFANTSTNFILPSYSGTGINVQNTTFCNSELLVSGPTGQDGFSLAFTNCILANVTNVLTGVFFSTNADYIGTYNSQYGTWLSHNHSTTYPLYPFQSAGGGNYYLTNNCPFRAFGTTNIDPTLLADIQKKTTYPPILYSNATFSNSMTFSPKLNATPTTLQI